MRDGGREGEGGGGRKRRGQKGREREGRMKKEKGTRCSPVSNCECGRWKPCREVSWEGEGGTVVICTFVCLAREALIVQEREAEGDGEDVEEIIVPCRNDAQLEKYLVCACVCVCVCVSEE